MKRVKTVNDFKKNDIMYHNGTGGIYKCTQSRYVKKLERSSGGSHYITPAELVDGVWFNMGSLNSIFIGLRKKAAKDWRDGNYIP